MSGPTPAPVAVSAAQQAVLLTLRRRPSCPQALALRAAIILGAASGQRNEPLARQLGCTATTIRKWRGRWHRAMPQLLAVGDDPAALTAAIAAALADAARAGAPATFTAEQIIRIVDLACRPPEQVARPIAAWTPRELADEAVKQGIVAAISPRSVERFLNRGRSAAAPEPLLAQREDQA